MDITVQYFKSKFNDAQIDIDLDLYMSGTI